MHKRQGQTALFCLSLLSILVGLGGCMQALGTQSVPTPVSKNNLPRVFHVVVFNSSGKPMLLEHEIGLQNERGSYASEADFRLALQNRALWSDECRNSSKYSFYIGSDRRSEVEDSLNAALGELQGVRIKILEDHPAAVEQRIRIDYWNDDFSYYSVYAVDRRSMTPLAYSDLVKGDGVVALGMGLKYTIIFYLCGRVLLAVGAYYRSRKLRQSVPCE